MKLFLPTVILITILVLFGIVGWVLYGSQLNKQCNSCEEPMWNVMLDTSNIVDVYSDGALFVRQRPVTETDPAVIEIRSRLLPATEAYSLYVQTNGSYPNAEQVYLSQLMSMSNGLDDIRKLSEERTVSCAAFLHYTSNSTSRTIPVGFDIAKGDVHVTVAKLSEFKQFAEGHVNQENPSDIISKELTASLIKADVDLLENNNYSPDDYFVVFAISGDTSNYLVHDHAVDEGTHITSPLRESIVPESIRNADSLRGRGLITVNATIWFDGFMKKLKKGVHKAKKATTNVVNDAANNIAHTTEAVVDTTVEIANDVANAIQNVSCGACKTIHKTALNILQNQGVNVASGEFCAIFTAELQAAVLSWLEACPQCEAIPVVAGAVCQNIVSKIIEDNLDLLDGNSRTQAAKLFCEAEGLCAT